MESWAVVVAAAIVAPLAVTALASVWEKRLAWPYAPMDEELPPTPYMTRAVALAQALGLKRIGIFRDGKGRMYRIRYEFWLSPQKDTLLLIGGGRLASLPVDGSWLFTRLGDGRCLVTLDDQRASEYDLAGLREEALFPGADLGALLRRHEERVAAASGLALPYSSQDPMSDHRDLLNRRVELLVQRGHARFADRNRGVWRYTARGAMLLSVGSHWTALRRSFRGNVT